MQSIGRHWCKGATGHTQSTGTGRANEEVVTVVALQAAISGSYRVITADYMATRPLKFPILIYRLDGPVELFSKRFREEPLDRDVELLGEHHGQARVNVVLCRRQLKQV